MTASPLADQPAPRSSRLPLVTWAALVVLALIQLWMIAATGGRPTPGLWGVTGWEGVFGLLFGSVGAVIAARRPDSRVGWLILGLGLFAPIIGVLNWYPVWSDSRAQALPAAELVRWLSVWAWVPFATVGTSLLPLVFPDGHLPSPRWRPALALAGAAAVTISAAIIMMVAPLGPYPAAPMVAAQPDRSLLLTAGFVLYVAATAAAGASMIYRYRHADAVGRQQIKWVAYAFALLVPAAAIGFAGNVIGALIELSALVVVVLAIAVAVLRYRLYEIDQIINRTLVYGFLTAILAGVYTASITLTQKLFQTLTNERSDASIVLTTLIVVSMFTPLKSRLQTMVDKRLKTAAAPASPAGNPASITLDTLTRLDALRVAGTVTQAEFEAKKAELLSRV